MKVRELHETIQKGKERVGEVAHKWPIRPNSQLRKQDRQRSLHRPIHLRNVLFPDCVDYRKEPTA
jgi:hypothetical protein